MRIIEHFLHVVGVACLVALCGAAGAAEEDPTKTAYERARRTLSAAYGEMVEARDRARRELPRFTYVNQKGQEFRFSAREVDAVFDKPLSDAIKDISALDLRRQAWLQGGATLDEFYRQLYPTVQAAIGRQWEAQIAIVRDGYIVGLRHRTDLLQKQQREFREKAIQRIRATLKGPAVDQAIRDLDRRLLADSRKAFNDLAMEYRSLKDRLARMRAGWVAESWRWVDFAAARTTDADDVHRRNAAQLEARIVHNFGYRVPNASVLWYFAGAPGSPDRIITRWPTRDWTPETPFPDIEPRDLRGVLMMFDVGRVPVEKLRPALSEAPLRRLEATSAGFATTNPDLPASEAVPNALVRVVARAAGVASTDRNRVLRGIVTNPGTGQKVEVMLSPWGRLAETFVSGVIHIAPNGVKPDEGPPTINACPGETLQVRVGAHGAALRVVGSLPADAPPPCAPPELPPRFSLTAGSRTQLQFDPENLSEYGGYLAGSGNRRRDARGVEMVDPPTVVYRDENGRPLPHEAIAWVLPDRNETFVSYTDEQGVARLDFRVGARGNFIAFIDGMPSSDPIPDGVQKIFAMPTDPLITSLLSAGPVRFDVDFIRPTVLDFIDRSGAQPGALVSGENFFVRVYLGRRDARKYGSQQNVQVRIDPPIQLKTPLLIEAARQVPNVYESQLRTNIRTKASATAAMGPGLLVDPNDIITAGFGSAQVGIKVYASHLDLAEERIRTGLAFWRDSVAAARSVSKADAARLELVAATVENGLAWLADKQLQQSYRVAAAAAYFGLVDKTRDRLSPFPSPETLQAYGSRAHTVHSRLEWDEVAQALAQAHRDDPTRLGNRVVRAGGAFVDFVVGLPDMLFVQPVLSGYTAVTGWTAEGELANTFERVMGGFDALLALAEAPAAVAGLAARGATAIRAAGRSSRRAIIGEGVLGGSLSLAGSLASSSGTALARHAPAYVSEAAMQIALEEMMADAGRREPLLARVGAPATDWTEPVLLAQPKKPRAQRLRDTIERRQRWAAERGGQLWDAKSRQLKHVPGSAEHKRLQDRIAHLEKVIERHENILIRAQRALGLAEGRDLTLEQLKAMRPPAKGRYRGSFVEKHYEWQVGKDLNSGVPGIPGGWEPGRRIPLEASYTTGRRIDIDHVPSGYQTLLSDGGYLATARNPTEYRMKAIRQEIIPDHYNTNTGDVGDSKYYDFRQINTDEKVRLCAAEINDTINKARLYQTHKIAQEMRRLANDPAHRWHKLEPAELERKAKEEAHKRRVFIFTPELMPEEIRAMILGMRALEGDAMSRIVFRKVDIAPDRW